MVAPKQSAFAPSIGVDRNALNVSAGPASTPPVQPADTIRTGVRNPFDRTGKLDMMLVAGVRAVMAVASVFIIWATPPEPQRLVVTYISLVAYSIYSVCVAFALSRTRAHLPHRVLAWLDVAFAGYLVVLTNGTSSIFFFFFSFAILSAAFSRGFREGMRITVASVLVFVIAGVVIAPFSSDHELEQTLIRPAYLLALGFLVSHWGGSELELKRRLALLDEIGCVYSRAGVDATIAATLRRLCVYFGADSIVLALEPDATRTSGKIYTASARDTGAYAAAVPASRETIRLFMAIPQRGTTWPRWKLPERYVPLDTPSRIMEIRGSEQVVSMLANMLEAKSVAVASYRQSGGVEGRLVLARDHKRLRDGDAAFLAHCASTLAAVVENVTLTAELVARATELERLSISRDLHDTTIQPYIGLRMAIEGVAREFRDSPPVAERLAHLLEMTDLGIEELREYMTRLKSDGGADVSPLGTAIERLAHRLARFYGLEVNVQVDVSLRLETRVADAIFQMVSEGLSNVVRHTAARRARVWIRSEGEFSVIEIANPLPDGLPPPRRFTPRSIAERAADLGGRIVVKPGYNEHTIVTVSIPQRLRAG